MLVLDVTIDDEFRNRVGTEEYGRVDHVPVPLVTTGGVGWPRLICVGAGTKVDGDGGFGGVTVCALVCVTFWGLGGDGTKDAGGDTLGAKIYLLLLREENVDATEGEDHGTVELRDDESTTSVVGFEGAKIIEALEEGFWDDVVTIDCLAKLEKLEDKVAVILDS